MVFSSLVTLVHQAGITLGVGASTFALTFYLLALDDGVVDASEKRFMHSVFFLLRIGMALIFLTLTTWGVMWFLAGSGSALLDSEYLFKWTALFVVSINAFLMTRHKMPMWLGPSLAGGSWYALFLINAWPQALPTYAILLGYYILFLVLFLAVFSGIKRYMHGAHKG